MKEFEEFVDEAPAWLNFVNTTLHLVLIGSFVFMGFFLQSPAPFIVANLVMRFCDLVMDVGLLSVINVLNLSSRTRKDLSHLHVSWTRGTVVFILFFVISLYLLHHGSISTILFLSPL